MVLEGAGLAFHDVLEHRTPGQLGVARGDRLDDLPMLVGRDRHQGRLGQVEAAEQAQLLDQLPVDRGQLGVARQLDDAVVEAQVEQVVGVCVLGLGRLLHLLDQGAHFLQRRRGDALGQAPADELLHRRPQVEDVDRLLDREAAHEHAPVLLGAHQPGFLEHAKGLAQRPAGDAETGGEGDLGELFARRQLAGEDHPLELALHHARERAGLQERDGRVGRGRGSGDGSGHGGE